MSLRSGPLFTEPAQLAGLKREARAGSTDNLREVARQFEALFTHMLMKNMRAASFGDSVFDNDQSKLYQDMFDQQISTELSSGSGLGIAELLVRQLGGDKTIRPPRDADVAAAMPLPARSAAQAAAVPAAPSGAGQAGAIVAPVALAEPAASGPVEFVKSALPHARRVAMTLGVAPKFILAQAALESGWGSRPIRNPDGSDSNNVFGIKAGSSWQGPRAVVDTLEFASGIGTRIKAAFRSYESLAHSFDDYARLLQENPRYRDALGAGKDGLAFASALARGGYATDPEYAGKIMGIANGQTLRNAISVLKNR